MPFTTLVLWKLSP